MVTCCKENHMVLVRNEQGDTSDEVSLFLGPFFENISEHSCYAVNNWIGTLFIDLDCNKSMIK